MKVKKIILIVILAIILIGIIFLLMQTDNSKKSEGNITVVVTNFAAYDFTRQIMGNDENITYLLGPGVDAHSFEPTTKDIINIQEADVFMYIGGELEKWAEKVISSSDLSNTKLVCLTDMVELSVEKELDGAEHHHEHEDEEFAYNEHIWTSPENAKTMVQKISEILINLDEENAKKYKENAENYTKELTDLQTEISKIVDAKVRDRLVFGDKMPMQYFLDEFGLTASAAFNGCTTETEPSSTTISYLIEKVKEEKIPVVLYIELSTGQVAKTIAEEAGVEIMQIQTLHNVSKDDFNNGETYVSLMKRNLEVLRKALK